MQNVVQAARVALEASKTAAGAADVGAPAPAAAGSDVESDTEEAVAAVEAPPRKDIDDPSGDARVLVTVAFVFGVAAVLWTYLFEDHTLAGALPSALPPM